MQCCANSSRNNEWHCRALLAVGAVITTRTIPEWPGFTQCDTYDAATASRVEPSQGQNQKDNERGQRRPPSVLIAEQATKIDQPGEAKVQQTGASPVAVSSSFTSTMEVGLRSSDHPSTTPRAIIVAEVDTHFHHPPAIMLFVEAEIPRKEDKLNMSPNCGFTGQVP